MEKDDTKPQTAIRCAKAAMLLHSLNNRRQQQEEEMRNQTIDDLKMELAIERYNRKNLKACNLFEFSILIVLLFSVSTFVLFKLMEVI